MNNAQKDMPLRPAAVKAHAVQARAAKAVAVKKTTDTVSVMLLKMICLTVEYPKSAIPLIPAKTRIAVYKAIERLKADGILAEVGKGSEKRLRFNAMYKGESGEPKAFELVKEQLGQDYYEHYIGMVGEHQKISTDKQKVDRRLRMAEVRALMNHARIEHREWMLPQLSYESKEKGANFVGTGYYDSRYLKRMPGTEPEVVGYSRMCGLLISHGGGYMVYNTQKCVQKDAPGGEGKMRSFISYVLNRNWTPPRSITRDWLSYGKDSIVIGKSYDTAKLVLEAERKKYEKATLRQKWDKRDDDTYFIPLSRYGGYMLWVMTRERWRERINEALLDNELLGHPGRAYDIYTPGDEKHYLAWFDSNIVTIRMVKESVAAGDDYTILCYEWQKEFLHKYIGDNVTIIPYSAETIKKIFIQQRVDE